MRQKIFVAILCYYIRMTKELRRVIEIVIAQMKCPKRVLEIGSRTTKNQEELGNLRGLFPQSEFVGLDMQKGSGVDVVADASALPFESKSFDLVLCLETLEHCERPWEIIAEIERVSKGNGGIILSSQQNFPLHMHPSDYFRYTPYGLSALIKTRNNRVMMGISPPFDREVELNPRHVVVIAWNGKVWEEQKLKRTLKAAEPIISGHKPYRHRVSDWYKIMRRAWNEINFRFAVKFFPYK